MSTASSLLSSRMRRINTSLITNKSHADVTRRLLAGGVALASFSFVAWALSKHPLGMLYAGLGVLSYAAIQIRWPHAWLLLIPALLPVIDMATTTGAIYLTESDLLLATAITVGYARLATMTPLTPNYPSAVRLSRLVIFLLALLTVSYVVSGMRGFLPYVPFSEQLSGYNNRWNSLRVAKGFFFALALTPMLVSALIAQGELAIKRLMSGLVIGLAGVCAFVLYERLAYTGITDFASDYRSTGPFWEMHVGGAALDGWIALTLPFTVWAVASSRRWYVMGLSLVLAAIAVYVALATFSRGVYGACLVSAFALVVLHVLRSGAQLNSVAKSAAWLLAAAAAVFWGLWGVFHTGGYRSMAAVVCMISATYLAVVVVRQCGKKGFAVAVLVVAAGVGVEAILYGVLSKGAYWGFALALAATAGGAMGWLKRSTQVTIGLLLGMWGVLATGGALVALHWGGSPALSDFLLVIGALALVVIAASFVKQETPRWTPRLGAAILASSAVLGLVVAATSGYYMGARFTQVGGDLEGRERHWANALGWLDSAGEEALGKGIGRFPDTYFWAGPLNTVPGTISFPTQNGNMRLKLTSARHPLDWGDILRVLQPVSVQPNTHPIVEFDALVTQPVRLHFEICGRHLLYPAGCQVKHMDLKPTDGKMQHGRVTFDAGTVETGPWYSPHRHYFAVALATSNATAELDNFQLIDGAGGNKLRNGDFSAAQDFWFFTSDRDHLPWHIKNVFFNIAFDQGMMGLLAFLLLWIAVFVRTLKHLREWPYAPYFLSALAGFFVVGLFDSLLDVPRLATLFYLMCFLLLVRGDSRSAQG